MTEQAAWRVVARGILLVFALILIALLARELQTVIVQLLVAILLAATITPSVDRLSRTSAGGRRSKIGRGLAAAGVSLGGALILVLASVAVLSTALPDLAGLLSSLPGYAGRIEGAIDSLATANPELSARITAALPSVSDMAGPALGMMAQAPRLASIATGIFGALVHVLFTLFLALYLTIDGDRI